MNKDDNFESFSKWMDLFIERLEKVTHNTELNKILLSLDIDLVEIN